MWKKKHCQKCDFWVVISFLRSIKLKHIKKRFLLINRTAFPKICFDRYSHVKLRMLNSYLHPYLLTNFFHSKIILIRKDRKTTSAIFFFCTIIYFFSFLFEVRKILAFKYLSKMKNQLQTKISIANFVRLS